jgi:hypothetical protein
MPPSQESRKIFRQFDAARRFPARFFKNQHLQNEQDRVWPVPGAIAARNAMIKIAGRQEPALILKVNAGAGADNRQS